MTHHVFQASSMCRKIGQFQFFITELLNTATLSVLFEDAEYLPLVFDICFCFSLRKFDRFTEHQTDRSKLYAKLSIRDASGPKSQVVLDQFRCIRT